MANSDGYNCTFLKLVLMWKCSSVDMKTLSTPLEHSAPWIVILGTFLSRDACHYSYGWMLKRKLGEISNYAIKNH